MIEILVYFLNGCNKCKKLFSEFRERSIRYSSLACEEDSKICDELEDYVNCRQYPIVKVKNMGHITYLCFDDFDNVVEQFNGERIEYYNELSKIIDRVEELKNQG
jgi:hypothetical protein